MSVAGRASLRQAPSRSAALSFGPEKWYSFPHMTGEPGAFPKVSRESPALIFVNSNAGGGRASSCLPGVQKLVATLSFPAEFVFTQSSEQLERCARTAIDAGRQVLLALGGDGTFQGLANAAFGSDVILGVLPAGG